MNKHFRIFLRIIGQFLVYTIVPGEVYFILLSILMAFGVREIGEPATTLIIDYLTLIVVFLAFRYYSTNVWNIVFQAKLQFTKCLQLIPISVLTRLPIVGVIAFLYIFFGDTITKTLDAGIEYQWSVFDGLTWQTTIMGFLSFVIIGPIHEELLYRGVIQRFLQKHYSIRTSILYSSFVFALAHIHPGLILNSFVLGLFLGYIFRKWNNLWYAIILHMLINLLPFIFQVVSK